jgi:hypothetical protein
MHLEKKERGPMAKATVVFSRIVQDVQNYGQFDQDANYMVSTLHFSLTVGGKDYAGLSVEVRQPYGTDFEMQPLEVTKPKGSYHGPWNHAAFSNVCEEYYRSLIGAKGAGIRIAGGKNIRMRNNTFLKQHSAELDIPDAGATSW